MLYLHLNLFFFILNELDIWKKGKKRLFFTLQIFPLQGKKIELILSYPFQILTLILTMRLNQDIVFISQAMVFLLCFPSTHEFFYLFI